MSIPGSLGGGQALQAAIPASRSLDGRRRWRSPSSSSRANRTLCSPRSSGRSPSRTRQLVARAVPSAEISELALTLPFRTIGRGRVLRQLICFRLVYVELIAQGAGSVKVKLRGRGTADVAFVELPLVRERAR